MKATSLGSLVRADADRLADFVIFTQRSCILNLSSELNKGDVSFPQFFLLAYLYSEDHLTMSDIARKVGHSTATATGLVDRLERLGYVKRFHAAEDRRKIMVRITPKGVELVVRMRKAIASSLVDLLTGMDEAAEDPSTLPLAELAELVKRLRDENVNLRAGPPARTTRRKRFPVPHAAPSLVSGAPVAV